MSDGADAVVGADRFYKLDVRNGVLARKCAFFAHCCSTCVALVDDSADASLTYFAREASMAHDYPVDAIVLVDAHGRPNGELLLVYQSESTTTGHACVIFAQTMRCSYWRQVVGAVALVRGNGCARRCRLVSRAHAHTHWQCAVYTAPYLYVMHFECVEVFRVDVNENAG
jgi:hypothetical protein